MHPVTPPGAIFLPRSKPTPIARRLAGVALCFAAAFTLSAAPASSFRAGAARIDITPAPDTALPMSGYRGRPEGFKAIHDPLHVRAIVLDDGTAKAAILSAELIGFSHEFWRKATERLARECGIPAENILLAAVHTHAAPAISTYGENPPVDLIARRNDYVGRVENALTDVVRQAQAQLQPARVGFGTGRANVNINRRAPNGEGGWMLGLNPEGPSDKTVAVLRFDTIAGEPIAIFSNYPVHGTALSQKNFDVSADLPGATSRAVEKHYGGRVVSPWTSGAGGDQCPLYDRGTDFRNLAALGGILAQEVVRIADAIQTVPHCRIRTLQRVVSCPGKRTVQPPARNGTGYRAEPADPVPIRLSLLMLNDIAVAGVSGEVLTNVAQRLKRESPFTRTFMVTHCNGSSGYLPDDAAYDQVSYEIVSARVQPGCAEDAIVNGLIGMMGEVCELSSRPPVPSGG